MEGEIWPANLARKGVRRCALGPGARHRIPCCSSRADSSVANSSTLHDLVSLQINACFTLELETFVFIPTVVLIRSGSEGQKLVLFSLIMGSRRVLPPNSAPSYLSPPPSQRCFSRFANFYSDFIFNTLLLLWHRFNYTL